MFCRQKQPFSICGRLWSFGHLRISCVLFLITWNLLKGTIFFLHSIADLEKLLQGRVIVFLLWVKPGSGRHHLSKHSLKRSKMKAFNTSAPVILSSLRDLSGLCMISPFRLMGIG